jgi:transcriptional regulator with XRE-family HTH domain
MLKNELMKLLGVRGVQARVARDLSLSATTVNKWAMGYNLPEPERLPDVERALGLPEGHLTVLAMPQGAEGLLADLRNEIQRLGADVQQLRSELAALRDERRQPPGGSPKPRRAAVGVRK